MIFLYIIGSYVLFGLPGFVEIFRTGNIAIEKKKGPRTVVEFAAECLIHTLLFICVVVFGPALTVCFIRDLCILRRGHRTLGVSLRVKAGDVVYLRIGARKEFKIKGPDGEVIIRVDPMTPLTVVNNPSTLDVDVHHVVKDPYQWKKQTYTFTVRSFEILRNPDPLNFYKARRHRVTKH